MHFRHRQTDRQTDTDIVAQARDVYITSRAKNVLSARNNYSMRCYFARRRNYISVVGGGNCGRIGLNGHPSSRAARTEQRKRQKVQMRSGWLLS